MATSRATRRFPRARLESAVMLRLIGPGQRYEDFARTRVLGGGGCMFVSQESLGYSTLMELLIACRSRVIKTDSRVVYEIQRGPSEFEVGVEFLRIAPADRALIEAVVDLTSRAA